MADLFTFTYSVETANPSHKVSFNPPFNIATATVRCNVHLQKFRCRVLKDYEGELDPTIGLLIDERTDIAASTDFQFIIDTLQHMKEGEGTYQFVLWGQDDQGRWNAQCFFIMVTNKALKTSSGQVFKAIYME